MATFEADFSVLANTTSYTNSDLVVHGNPAAIVGGDLTPRDKPATVYITHPAVLESSGNIDIDVTVGFSSGSFALSSAGVGLFDKDSYKAYLIRVRFNEVTIKQRNADGSTVLLNDFTTTSYAVGDVLRFRFNRDLAEPRIQSFLNGALLKTITSPITDISNYRAGIYVSHDSASNKDGFRTFSSTGLVLATPMNIKLVGAGNAVTQYQRAVTVELEGIDTADVSDAAFAGFPVTPTVVDATKFTFDVPGDLATGSYGLFLMAAGTGYSKLVTYTQTHQIELPDAGTAVDENSVMAQLGNPNNTRYLRLEKPSALSWKSPYTEFDAENIILDIRDLFTAPVDAAVNSTYQSVGSLIDDTGVVTDFTMTFSVEAEPNENSFSLIIKPIYQAIYSTIAE
ncbi:hypothetical protein [Allohahella sp. A8]|uniref:hypothetical protein n=1 Tax=Allohahella sp. A8 TaxID=3141461 RepID=UPI003A8081E9